MSDADQVMADAQARVQQLAEHAAHEIDRVMAEVEQQLDALKAAVHAETGLVLEVPWSPTSSVPTSMDATMAQLADMAYRCRQFLAAAELLRPHVKPGSPVTVGRLVKTRLSQRKAERVLAYLHRSAFFADGGEVCDG